LFLINSLKEKTTFRLIRETLEEGKEVYALDMAIDNKTHNSMLISKGAYPIRKVKDLKK
jgi:predicted Rossmann fold nucleotide-binding protein DprA/Smf involved in DNA uptake